LVLLHSKSEIIPLRLTISDHSILLLSSSNGSDLVSLGSLCAWNHLWVMVLNTRIVHDLGQMLVILLSYQLGERLHWLRIDSLLMLLKRPSDR
jgi:hypothetical protein